MTKTGLARAGVLLAGLVLGGRHQLEAQRSGSVRGVVLDAATAQVVPLVIVSVVGLVLRDTTDARGRYEIRGVPLGPVQVEARRLGFQPITSPVYALLADSILLVHFEMTPQAVTLEGVEVRGEPPEPRAAIGAKVLKQADLPGRGSILDALQGVVAGVQTSGRREDTRVTIRGSHADVLYVIDGTVVTPPLTFYIDTQDVECVEVRRGYRAAQEFRPSISGQLYSGVILIWTRGSLAPQPKECGAKGT
ncbi:MAG TPA: carboxypeptidase regulatory-like domain-containing protein [Gemmatimonadales bacterium]|nr:carboxypeptidase regulatory-like domain-containing protein [Gemmatimonadales bacterium]